MSKTVATLITIVAFSLGIVLGRSSLSTKQNLDQEFSQHEDNDQLKAKLQALTDHDIAEYYRLKDDAEKYKKADEILAKIMTVFLHDLGIRLSQPAQNKIAATGGRVDASSSSDTQVASSGGQTATVGKSNSLLPKRSDADDFRIYERSRFEIRTEADIDKFLENVKIDNLDEALKDTGNFNNRTHTLEALKGKFSGKSTVKIDEKYRTWDVEITLDAKLGNDNNLSGYSTINMSENGKNFSSSNDKGSVTLFREFNSGSDAILLRASPSVQFQLYYIKNSDSLIGNVYRRNSEEDPFRNIGTVQLNRN